ncbi:MAG: ATP-sensitive inward rectifier potassium channel 10, partial [Deltaproteobacteria bacterium]
TPRPAVLRPDGAAPPGRRRIGGAVRIGTPSAIQRDLYFYLMQGSWTRFFAVFVALYLAFNVLFAGLYLLDPTSVANLEQGSFMDAFAFSVQTMSTIGYGAMSPISDYAHVLVTAQAGLAVIFAALVTGLIFAKASRPRSHVVFSQVVTVSRYHGAPTLMLRVGNARGNEVVEATMRVSALVEDVSPEGQRMGRVHDLALVRDSSPLFTMSWTVMHVVDGDSCLASLAHGGDERIVGLICVLMGFDSTYGQTIHARQVYYFPEDFRLGQRFVDVVETHPDGHVSIDFTRFHDTEPEQA